MFHPPPRQPHPTGRFPIDTAPRERFPSAGFRRGTPRRILFSPVARHPNYRHALPALSEGGGRRPRQRPGGEGVFQRLKTVPGDTSRDGGRYPIDTLPERRLLLCRQYEHPHRNPVPARRRWPPSLLRPAQRKTLYAKNRDKKTMTTRSGSSPPYVLSQVQPLRCRRPSPKNPTYYPPLEGVC